MATHYSLHFHNIPESLRKRKEWETVILTKQVELDFALTILL